MAGNGLALPQGMKRDGEKRCPFGRVTTIIVTQRRVEGADQAPPCAEDKCALWSEQRPGGPPVVVSGCLFARALEKLADKA